MEEQPSEEAHNRRELEIPTLKGIQGLQRSMFMTHNTAKTLQLNRTAGCINPIQTHALFS
jgi:hypothetical protein